MAKKLLEEATVRRFMKIAGLQPLSESFVDTLEEEEKEEKEKGQELDDFGLDPDETVFDSGDGEGPKRYGPDGKVRGPVQPKQEQKYMEAEEEMAPEAGEEEMSAEEPGMDAEEPEMEMSALSLSDDQKVDLIQKFAELIGAADMIEKEEEAGEAGLELEPAGEEEAGEEEAGEEEVPMEEAMEQEEEGEELDEAKMKKMGGQKDHKMKPAKQSTKNMSESKQFSKDKLVDEIAKKIVARLNIKK